MHWWTLVVGVLLGMFVVPMVLKMVGGGGSKTASS
jgi:hypothetical protein